MGEGEKVEVHSIDDDEGEDVKGKGLRGKVGVDEQVREMVVENEDGLGCCWARM